MLTVQKLTYGVKLIKKNLKPLKRLLLYVEGYFCPRYLGAAAEVVKVCVKNKKIQKVLFKFYTL